MPTPDSIPLSGHRELSWWGHVRATCALGLPLIGAQLAQMAINVTDTVMIGQLGATELAAGVLGTQMFFIVYIFGVGFAHAVMPVAASAAGQGDLRGVRRSVRMGLWVLVLYSALVMWPLWHAEAILLSLGQEPEAAAIAGDYVRVVQWAMLPALTIMGLRSFLSVVRRAHVVLWAFVGAASLNAFLNYIFIFGHFGAPALGVTGAAVASLGTYLLAAGSMLAYVLLKSELQRYELAVRMWRPDWDAFFEVVRLGWPIGLTIIAEVGLFAASSIMMGWLGTIPLAAHGIVLQLASIAFMIPLGLASAATVRVGVAFGRGDRLGLKRAGDTALAIAVAVAVAAAILFWTIPEQLIGLYLDEGNPNAAEVLQYGMPLLAVAAAFQIVDGLQAVGSGVLRGMKDTRTPMLIALFSYWAVGMPAAYVLAFPLGWEGVGVWCGLAFGLSAAAFLMNRRYLARERNGLLSFQVAE